MCDEKQQQSNNTTIYNRPILCNSQEQLGEFVFSLSFVKWFNQYRATGNSELRRKKKHYKTNTVMSELESQRTTNLGGITGTNY